MFFSLHLVVCFYYWYKGKNEVESFPFTPLSLSLLASNLKFIKDELGGCYGIFEWLKKWSGYRTWPVLWPFVPMILKSQKNCITLSHKGFSLLVMIFTKIAQLNLKPMTTQMKYCIGAYFSSILHKYLTPNRFVADSSLMTWTRLIRDL